MTPAALTEAAERVRAGGVVALPTETFYGLAIDPGNAEALDRLAELKGRGERGKPFLLLAAGLEDIAPWVAQFPANFSVLAARFWPGPLTLVLPAASHAPRQLVGPSGGVAVRVTSHPLARKLVGACGVAITGTSANRAGAKPALSAADVVAAFGDEVLVLDGGALAEGLPSTLVDLTGNGARILRIGVIPEEAVRSVVTVAD